MTAEEARARLAALGLADEDERVLFDHFDDAERRGKLGHGYARIPWLETQRIDAAARPVKVASRNGLDHWDGGDALGYLTLAAIVDSQLADPPEHARIVVAERCFPTGMLGHYVRRLAEGGLVAALTATSPARLGHPAGGPKLAGTNPLAVGIPSAGGEPIVVDVSMGEITWGDVIAGHANEEDLVPFGGEHAHKSFALALGLQLLVDSVAGEGYGAVMLVARPRADPVPGLRERAVGVRLPGDG